jgi:hypothetical protein
MTATNSQLMTDRRLRVSQSQSHIATDGQSVSQSVSLGVEPNLGLMTRCLFLFDSCGLFFFGGGRLL